jgi:alpha-glucosidase
MPPFYALGFFQGSSAYTSLAQVEAVQAMYEKYHFLVEGYHLDAYNTAGNEIFTVDGVNFKGLKDFVTTLSTKNQHLTLGLMEGIKEGTDTYTQMSKDKSLLLNAKGAVLMNILKETYVAYPDWFSDQTSKAYVTGLAALTTSMGAFSGLTLNENTNFGLCDYECYPKTEKETAVLDLVHRIEERRLLFLAEHGVGQTDPKNEEEVGNYESYGLDPNQDTAGSLYNMPFQMGAKMNSSYGNATVSLNATHSSLTTFNTELYNHNLNGLQSAKTLATALKTDAALKADYGNKRPFLMSESTFPGAGQYTGTWLSNYHRTWTDMKNSIASVMNLNMFGIAMAGTEICGSLGKLDAELCARWA